MIHICVSVATVLVVVSGWASSSGTTDAYRLLTLVQTMVLLILLGMTMYTVHTMQRHQKALEWFAGHIKLDSKVQVGEVPEALAQELDDRKDGE